MESLVMLKALGTSYSFDSIGSILVSTRKLSSAEWQITNELVVVWLSIVILC